MKLLLFSLVFLSLLPTAGRADDASASTEGRLRDALRSTMLQLRDAQSQTATLQASQADSDKQNADLKAKVEALTAQVSDLTKQSASDKAASDKAISDLKTQVASQAAQITQFTSAIEEWKKSYNDAVAQAKATEAAREDLAGKVIVLQRMVDDRERENLDLFNTGNAILDRYEKFSLGDALSAKEPFVGVSRVHLENLVQDYRDKLLDGKITAGQLPTDLPNPASGAGHTSTAPATNQAKSDARPAVKAE